MKSYGLKASLQYPHWNRLWSLVIVNIGGSNQSFIIWKAKKMIKVRRTEKLFDFSVLFVVFL